MKKRILIADDSQVFLISIGLLLKRLGFGVLPGENGVEVLKLAKMSEPHLIILDINMEIMDGITVLRHLKGDKRTSRIPVIMLSSDSKPETIEKCKSLGCSAYVQKPLKIQELYEAVQSCFYPDEAKRRNHLRCALNKKINVRYNGEIYQLYSETISAGGIYLRKNEPFPIGSKIDMTLPLDEGLEIQLKGVVIYTQELFGGLLKLPPGMAVEFKGIAGENYDTMVNFVENLLAADILEEQGGAAFFRSTK
jgi:two-component system, chemotaxis family, chemotaxis protein CheY